MCCHFECSEKSIFKNIRRLADVFLLARVWECGGAAVAKFIPKAFGTLFSNIFFIGLLTKRMFGKTEIALKISATKNLT